MHFKLLAILTTLCIINKTSALNCWCCSSDESDSAFCGKFLDESNLTDYQKAVNLVECTYPYYDLTKVRDLITKCLIQKTTYNGKLIYSRSCVWEERNADKDACFNHSPAYGHHIEACDTCLEDKCNYQLTADSHDVSTRLIALYDMMFICLVIVLKI